MQFWYTCNKQHGSVNIYFYIDTIEGNDLAYWLAGAEGNLHDKKDDGVVATT